MCHLLPPPHPLMTAIEERKIILAIYVTFVSLIFLGKNGKHLPAERQQERGKLF